MGEADSQLRLQRPVGDHAASYGVLWQSPGIQPTMRDVVAECLAVAGAAGVVIPEAPGTPSRIAETMPASCPQRRRIWPAGSRAKSIT